jgi:signal transduction histidine kinase
MTTSESSHADSYLVAGLEAFHRGEDALLAALATARKQVGARFSVWMAPPASGGGFALCDPGGMRRTEEFPIELPVGWMSQSIQVPLRLFGPSRMGRDSRARALGIEWGLVGLSMETGARVWFASPTPLDIQESWTHALIRSLELLSTLDHGRIAKDNLERLAAMGEQAANVTHDLRNQLSLTRLEFEVAGIESGTNLERASQALGKALELCSEFMADDLRAARIPKPLAPHVVTQIQEAIQLSGREGEVRVVKRCPHNLCAVFDGRLLDRYLRNLLLNGIDATPCGGVVRVEARGVENGVVELVVTDAGKGMERRDLERLLNAGETRGGTGFGTSSILDCAQRLHADLDVESEPGAGTRICLSLPRE